MQTVWRNFVAQIKQYWILQCHSILEIAFYFNDANFVLQWLIIINWIYSFLFLWCKWFEIRKEISVNAFIAEELRITCTRNNLMGNMNKLRQEDLWARLRSVTFVPIKMIVMLRATKSWRFISVIEVLCFVPVVKFWFRAFPVPTNHSRWSELNRSCFMFLLSPSISSILYVSNPSPS